jgi:DNA-binding transcriptional MocR family regulator
VAFAVGSVFYPQDPGHSSLRLNFAAHSPAQIDEGLRRLGKAVREQLKGVGVASNLEACAKTARGTRAR